MIKNKNISYDFDGTLDDHFDGCTNPSKLAVRKTLLNLQSDNNIFIITKRFDPSYSHMYNESEKVFNLAKELNIKPENIFFTNRSMKTDMVKKLNIDIHFEDDQYEVSLLSKICQVVNVEQDNWEQEFYGR